MNKISGRLQLVMHVFIQKYWTITMDYSMGKVTQRYLKPNRLILSDKVSVSHPLQILTILDN